ncbi:hypothetical protein [Nonomuraea glycinis]|uniref:hypothetical protein n=1 Tax=Nonomuraea glycinis TaxID=2047744 RepID=UPI0033B1EF3E
MTTKPLDEDDIAVLAGCGAFVGATVRNIIIVALALAAVLTEGVLSGILWSAIVAYTLAASINTANRTYQLRRKTGARR